MIAPFAVDPFARPTTAPTAAPDAPPMIAPVSFLFSDAQPLETTRPASIGMTTNVRIMRYSLQKMWGVFARNYTAHAPQCRISEPNGVMQGT